MATAKQLAARERFAKLAKSGALAKMRRKSPAKKRATNPAPAKSAAKKTAPRKLVGSKRKTNPDWTGEKREMRGSRLWSGKPFVIVPQNGAQSVTAEANTVAEAKKVASLFADHYGRPFAIVSRDLYEKVSRAGGASGSGVNRRSFIDWSTVGIR